MIGRHRLVHGRLFFEADTGGGGSNGDGGTGAGADGKADQGTDGDAKAGDWKPPATQADLDALIVRRLAQQEKALTKKISDQTRADLKAESDAEAKKIQGDFESLYTAELAKRETAERERDAERISAMRSRIAAKHKLPDAFADRLKGDDEAAMEADAKDLAKFVKPPAAPDTEGGAGRRGGGTGSSANPERKQGTNDGKPVLGHDGQPKAVWPTT